MKIYLRLLQPWKREPTGEERDKAGGYGGRAAGNALLDCGSSGGEQHCGAHLEVTGGKGKNRG